MHACVAGAIPAPGDLEGRCLSQLSCSFIQLLPGTVACCVLVSEDEEAQHVVVNLGAEGPGCGVLPCCASVTGGDHWMSIFGLMMNSDAPWWQLGSLAART